MKTTQTILILLFALWLPGCGVFGGADNGQDNGSQDLGQTDLYPCGVTDDALVWATFTLEPGDNVVDLLPSYEADPVEIVIEAITVEHLSGTSFLNAVELRDAPNVVDVVRDRISEHAEMTLLAYPEIDPLDVNGEFTVRDVRFLSSSATANELARESGATCNPVPPFMREF